MSPKFKIQDGYIFKIFSNEERRMHIHAIKDDKEAKIWLQPKIEIAHNHGFTQKEINAILKITKEYGKQFKQQYEQHIGKSFDD